MFRCISPNKEKLISKGIESVYSRITNLKKYLKNTTKKELVQYLNDQLTNEQYILDHEEISKIEKMSEKYSEKKWIFDEHPQYDKKLKKRFNWGYLEILLSLKKGKIKQIFLKGDFFNKNDNLSEFLENFLNVEYTKENIKKILQNVDISNYILNSNNKDFAYLLEEGILNLKM
ncbi:MAG: lipoate protein ligase C-terminal domain-containing protein [Candidatus Phytoplasma stylosanthis]|nr:lipoate protein ligase C-terminal domain-containing protein [Candidatus Phytoplasma stylosanthis]